MGTKSRRHLWDDDKICQFLPVFLVVVVVVVVVAVASVNVVLFVLVVATGFACLDYYIN